MSGEVSEEQILGGGRFIGLNHEEILQCLDTRERKVVGNSICGDFDSAEHRISTLARVAVERFGIIATNEVE